MSKPGTGRKEKINLKKIMYQKTVEVHKYLSILRYSFYSRTGVLNIGENNF